MKRLYLFFIGIFISFIFCGCTTTKPQPIRQAEKNNYADPAQLAQDKLTTPDPAPKQCPLKDPIAIAFSDEENKPLHPYKIIAKESISQFNTGGIKRQEATIHDVLRQLAASIGGDAVINIKEENQRISGEVIKFQV